MIEYHDHRRGFGENFHRNLEATARLVGMSPEKLAEARGVTYRPAKDKDLEAVRAMVLAELDRALPAGKVRAETRKADGGLVARARRMAAGR